MLKGLSSIYDGSDSQFFRTTTAIQSGPNNFGESRFVTAFLTILGVMEILCSFRLAIEYKAGKEIPESSRLVFRKVFKQILLLYQMQKAILLVC